MTKRETTLWMIGLFVLCLTGSGWCTAVSPNTEQKEARAIPWPPKDRVVQGIVVDPNGAPVSKAGLVVCGALLCPDTTSDEDGRFLLQAAVSPAVMRAPRGTYLIVRERRRNLAAVVQLDWAPAGDLTVKLAPGVALSGTVTDERGKAVPAATLTLFFEREGGGDSMREEASILGPDGRYRITAVPANRRFNINATAEGYSDEWVDADTYDALKGRLKVEPLILRRADRSVSGVVVDVNDRPVPNATVSFDGEGQHGQQVVTDALGRFTARGFHSGELQIEVMVNGRNPLSGSGRARGGATGVKVLVLPAGAPPAGSPAVPPSLVGKHLPSMTDLGIEMPAEAYKDQRILLCFFDTAQRPSRNTLSTLAKRAAELRQKGVTVLAIQAGDADGDEVKQWLNQQRATLPIGLVNGSGSNATAAWGVRALPWLILTDQDHAVTAEGFGVDDLDARLQTPDR